MTVRELIAELEKFPPDIPVDVEGYAGGTEDENIGYVTTGVNGWENEDDQKGVTIWACKRGTLPEPIPL